MLRFARLFDEIDSTTSTNAKVAAMARYFAEAPPADAAWAVFFLTGRRLKRLVPYAAIHDWTLADTRLPSWLLEESYSVVGDGAETAALVLDQLPVIENPSPLPLVRWVEERILTLRDMAPDEQRRKVTEWWAPLDRLQRFVLLKMITGELRVGVSQTLVVRALSHAAGIPVATVAARLMGEWAPTPEWFGSVLSIESTDVDQSRPYPFFLASPLDEDAVGARRAGGLDSRVEMGRHPRTAGETRRRHPPVVAWRGADHPSLPGDRRGRHPSARRNRSRWRGARVPGRTAAALLGAAAAHRPPETGRADGESRPGGVHDLRRAGAERPGHPRISRCATAASGWPTCSPRSVHPSGVLRLSPSVTAASWDDLAQQRRESRDRGVEGLMLKRASSPYAVGRKRGDWWKWKIEPYTIDAVLIYAQPGSGKRASLLTDYTFGVWHEGELVPIAKAYSGLSNEEIGEMDRWIRRHTKERFGPVRHVEPIHVFELGFEGIARSPRHRSGIAVRFPRMLRWRKDKRPEEADTLENVRRLLESVEAR